MLYKICGLIIESNIPLPELPHAIGKEPEYAFRLIRGQEPDHDAYHWFNQWRLPDGEIWLSLTKTESGYLLRFPDFADFLVPAHGKEISCSPRLDTPLDTIRHLFLDQVMPLVLSKAGRLVLHASAVSAPEGAVAFLGVSGQGKSTLAASFCQQGFRLLTDDCLLLKEEEGQIVAIPSYPGLRLWSETITALFDHELALARVAQYTEKKRLGPGNSRFTFSSDSAPLRRVYVLVPPEKVSEARGITIAPLSPQEAFIELVRYAYKLDITDRERLKEEFDCISHIVSKPFFYRLTFPRNISLLASVRESILENLREGSAAQQSILPGPVDISP